MSKITLTCRGCGVKGIAEGPADLTHPESPMNVLRREGWTEKHPEHCETCECFDVFCPECSRKNKDMFEFRIKQQSVSISYIEGEPNYPNAYPGQVIRQTVLTFDNGRSWVLPFEFLRQLLEPATEEARAFVEGLDVRMKPPKPENFEQFMDVDPKDEGGFTARIRNKKT